MPERGGRPGGSDFIIVMTSFDGGQPAFVAEGTVRGCESLTANAMSNSSVGQNRPREQALSEKDAQNPGPVGRITRSPANVRAILSCRKCGIFCGEAPRFAGVADLQHPRRITEWGWKAGARWLILLAMNEIRPPLPVEEPRPDPSSAEFRPTVIVAPELRGRQDFVVIREPDETDEDYQSRCELVALLLDYAEKG